MSSYESNSGYSSSSYSSESRYTSSTRSYPTYYSESRYDDGESRYEKSNSSYDSGESKSVESEYDWMSSSSSKFTDKNGVEIKNKSISSFKKNTVDVRNVDELIRKLESKQFAQTNNEGINKALEARRNKIEELKTLALEAKKIAEEEELLRDIQKENSELDDAIISLKKGLHR